jgi:hypothetical protein
LFKEGENVVTVTTLNEKNPIDMSLKKTTTTVTKYPDGRVEKTTYLEVIENEVDPNASFDSNDSFGNTHFYHLIKKKYEDDYDLKENQFDLIKSCFDKLDKRDDYINKYVFRHYIMDQVSERATKVTATERDVNRAIDAVDFDNDGDIDFNEYLDFLFLFFAKRQNIRRRIVNILNGHSFSHTRKGELNETEMASFLAFLKSFYGVSKDEHLRSVSKKTVTYKEFANLVYPILKERVFVK